MFKIGSNYQKRNNQNNDKRYNLPRKLVSQEQKYYAIAEKDVEIERTKKDVQLEQLVVYDPQEYIKLEGVLEKRVEILQQSITISKQKNTLKDKEIQIIAQTIDKAIQKNSQLQNKISQKEKRLNRISIKCHQLTQIIAKQQQKIKKQSIILHEETENCTRLNEDITYLQKSISQSQRQLQRFKKIEDSLQEVLKENNDLKIHLNELQSQEKMMQYRESSEQRECFELQQKLDELKSVYKQRSKVNKRNMIKLNNLKKQINSASDANTLKNTKAEDIKNLELELGELNQDLLLTNEEISELDYKIRKKNKVIDELRFKLTQKRRNSNNLNKNSLKKEPYQILESEQDEQESDKNKSNKTSRKNSAAHSKSVQLPVYSKNNSPSRNRSNVTPTFTSNDLQEQSYNMKSVDEVLPANQAFKNIEKLINRFEVIKSKDKNRPT